MKKSGKVYIKIRSNPQDLIITQILLGEDNPVTIVSMAGR